jgi:hypothetical protein
MRAIDKQELAEILAKHAAWLRGETDGVRADLSSADLDGANLPGANLYNANLSGANLSNANLSGAYLPGANLYNANLSNANLSGAILSNTNLSYANLSNANLRNANLRNANLSGANLSGANLSNANLRNANLSGANLYNANLSEANLPPFQLCPDGQFRGYKKLAGDIIAELLIPCSAQRTSSLVGRKCRASKAKVIQLTAPDGSHPESAVDQHTGKLEYRVGCWVKPDKFDADIRVECTSGIHFFIARKEAEDY